jgi:hypothetical protein
MKKETNELYSEMEQDVLDEFRVEELEERLEMSAAEPVISGPNWKF